MLSFNTTNVHLNTTRTSPAGNVLPVSRTPAPRANESFYFNQDSLQVIVYYGLNYHSTSTSLSYKECSVASVHLTDKRLVFLAQTSDINSTNGFDTCELELSNIVSLKFTRIHSKRSRLDIRSIQSGNDVRIDINFNCKNATNRRNSLHEYIKMATSTLSTSHLFESPSTIQEPDSALVQDIPPPYSEAVKSANITYVNAPPAYC